MSDAVPFGRYRGRPLADMLADRPYLEWLVEQAFLSASFPEIHLAVVNAMRAPPDPIPEPEPEAEPVAEPQDRPPDATDPAQPYACGWKTRDLSAPTRKAVGDGARRHGVSVNRFVADLLSGAGRAPENIAMPDDLNARLDALIRLGCMALARFSFEQTVGVPALFDIKRLGAHFEHIARGTPDPYFAPKEPPKPPAPPPLPTLRQNAENLRAVLEGLKAQAHRAGLDHAAMLDQIGVNPGGWSVWEKGNQPKPYNWQRLVAAWTAGLKPKASAAGDLLRDAAAQVAKADADVEAGE